MESNKDFLHCSNGLGKKHHVYIEMLLKTAKFCIFKKDAKK